MRYPEIYPPEDDSYHPTVVSRTMFIERADRSVGELIVETLRESDAALRVVQLRVLGGAVARVPADATAFAHRASRIMANVAAFYDGPHDRIPRQTWVTDFVQALRQDDMGAYVNFMADEDQAAARSIPGRNVGSARSGQGALRPDKPLPAQPEYPASICVK